MRRHSTSHKHLMQDEWMMIAGALFFLSILVGSFFV